MAVTEQQRHRLLAWFEEQMGQDLGATMMELLPPADASQLATRADLLATKADLKAEIVELRAEVKGDMLQLQRSVITWMIGTQAGVIAAVGLLLGLAH